MQTVCEKSKCSGCMACVDICPKNAVRIEDTIREYNAVIDSDLCVNCGACHKVCQQNNPPEFRKPILWKQGWAEDSAVRAASSSGGFAAALELAFVRSGGVVCSCAHVGDDYGFIFAHSEDEVKRFAGSKYVKSNPAGAYKEIAKLLKSGSKVLFVGLPCQAAAARNYTRDHENLYTVDLICHGSPSPKVLASFLEDYNMKISDLGCAKFREGMGFRLNTAEKPFNVPAITDTYTKAFLSATSYTENCYSCRYARVERVSDITIGDSWGSELGSEQMRAGISLALCQTEKGISLLNNSGLCLFDVDLDHAVSCNHQLESPSEPSPQREMFISGMESGEKFKKVAGKCFPTQNLKNKIKRVLYVLHIKR